MAKISIKTSKLDSDGGPITYTDAKAMITEYEKSIAHDPDNNVKYFRIKAEYLRELTTSSDCEYVSFYIALNPASNQIKRIPVGHTLILVGVNANEENMVIKKDDPSNKIYQHLRGCPPYCKKSDGTPETF